MIGQWLAAVRGGMGFLTRLPVGYRDGDWDTFRSRPAVFPVVGLVGGAIAAIPLLAADRLAPATVAFGYLLTVYAVFGIHHLDGVADLGDALVVHGDLERRREVLKDTTTGVGALLAVSITVTGLALGGLGLAGLPALTAVTVAIAAEAGTKLGMAAMACFGTAEYEGMGRQFTEAATPGGFVVAAGIVLGVGALGFGAGALGFGAGVLEWPHPAVLALVGAVAGIGLPWYWADRHLGGLSGDIFGAANEIGRVAGVHAGVIAWTLL